MKRFRKTIAAVCAAVLLGTAGTMQMTASALSETEQYYLGDISGNGLVDVPDIIMLQQHLLGLPVNLQVDRVDLGDIDRNDVIDIFDLGYLKKMVLGTYTPEQPDPPPDTSLYAPTTDQFEKSMPCTGTAKLLSVFVEFQDRKFSDQKLPLDTLREELYGTGQAGEPYDSITGWYDRASYGNLRIEGDCLYVTCSGNMSDYMYWDEQGTPLYEKTAVEVLTAIDEQVDFSQYDGNGDGLIDCMSFAVPLDDASYDEKQYWWGCTAIWYENPYFTIDGMRPYNYIIMDQSPYAETIWTYKQTAIHEMGHCLGLPDYYVYGDGDHYTSSEGLIGDAGFERMDDSVGDFSSFSKLMLGWLSHDQVQWYEGSGAQTFELSDLSTQGSCLILSISAEPGDLHAEYFMIEYLTPIANNVDMKAYAWWNEPYGVRILHVDAELFTDQWNRTAFKYDNFGENYLGSDRFRVIRLVNEQEHGPFYRTGNICTFGTANFAGYDANGYQTVNTGYTVTIGEVRDGRCTVTVEKQ